MVENGKRRRRWQLTPEEKWEVFVEVISQGLSGKRATGKRATSLSPALSRAASKTHRRRPVPSPTASLVGAGHHRSYRIAQMSDARTFRSVSGARRTKASIEPGNTASAGM